MEKCKFSFKRNYANLLNITSKDLAIFRTLTSHWNIPKMSAKMHPPERTTKTPPTFFMSSLETAASPSELYKGTKLIKQNIHKISRDFNCYSEGLAVK